ncbi:hypothetical protein [Aerosakkonema funiforme]|uniref:Uncharacterized protein n=1 Tax=Aerosakkonema funiforme FACHB-1375 TaxID=2949571 RepID=A0A926VEG1_9CYAN|nr:hypothetical protein [Aerosakkonema funiforme]MBD2181743.1 hypothetical protein [Aerosakkonema funiforme FACHB-1375]
MASKHGTVKFPLWQYLNQPLFSSTTKLELNPRRFCYVYRVKLLERCLAKECQSEGRRPKSTTDD